MSALSSLTSAEYLESTPAWFDALSPPDQRFALACKRAIYGAIYVMSASASEAVREDIDAKLDSKLLVSVRKFFDDAKLASSDDWRADTVTIAATHLAKSSWQSADYADIKHAVNALHVAVPSLQRIVDDDPTVGDPAIDFDAVRASRILPASVAAPEGFAPTLEDISSSKVATAED